MSSNPERDYIQGATGDWELVIGMEVHAQVISNSKLFSGAATEFGAEPNSQVSLIDAAMPGMLPVINQACIRQAVKTGLGLKAKINLYSVFDRKNYFYPDLPQGYQISQFKFPIVGEGEVELDLEDGRKHKIGIERLHLEQDAGKSLHDQHPDYSLVDLNRSGVGLMEIVSKPDIRSVTQAQTYITKLRTILRYLGTCDGNMEEGSLRADINVSVRRPGEELGTRCEIKNVNSVRFMRLAINYEARRQIDILESGGAVEQETRLFDARSGKTRSMRSKEEAHDYRYFPDPDLIPLELSQEEVDEIAASLPELPDQKKERFINQYGLSQYDAGVLTAESDAADYFEQAVVGLEPKLVANWITGELFAALNKLGVEITKSPVSPSQLTELLELISDDVISGRIAKNVFEIMLETGHSPAEIVRDRNLEQVTDSTAIEKIIDQIIAEYPKQVEQIKTRPKTIGWFVGQVMKASQGKANPAAVNEILRRKLELE